MTADCTIHHWYVDFSTGTLTHQISGEERRLGEYQLKLLRVLTDHAGEVLTREALNSLVWEQRVIGNNSLPNAIHALRLALEDDGKQQKIIRTIPKKGYILEAKYCHFHGADPLSTPADELHFTDKNREEQEIASIAEVEAEQRAQAEDRTSKPDARRFGWLLVTLQGVLLAALVSVILAPHIFSSSTQYKERSPDVYSNIQLVELFHKNENTSPADDFNKMLEPTFFALNESLKNKGIKMEVFFFASGTSLNYTFNLSDRCSTEQLAMNILNWRMNASVLSALIYRETERKLNEMANCIP